ncbi:MAG: NIPSNAP family protein [Bacteroidota bacterium]
MRKKIVLLLSLAGFLFLYTSSAFANKAPGRDFYEIKVYHVSTSEQVKKVNAFLQNAYLPALHKAGIEKVGVYQLTGMDTASDKKIYVFIPLRSLDQVNTLEELPAKDPDFIKAANGYWNAAHDAAPYLRIESIVLKAFALMPNLIAPSLSGNKTEHIYELRSYEGATERLYRQKVHMFNEGGEIALFSKLQFNTVFYAQVLAGSRMPNLMYMTSFNNMTERDEHWKAFGADTDWKRMSSLPEYQNTVSKADIILLNPAEFSEL